MIGLTGWVEIISAVLKFPAAVLRLVNALKKTDQENHEALVKAIEAEAANIKKTGRPTWG
jgi:hypothetical protein